MNLKTIIQRGTKAIKNPILIYKHFLYKFSPLFPDRFYLEQLFPIYTGYKLNLDDPQTFNEKLQWLKINYRNPIQTKMVDKYEAKLIAEEIIGKEYIVKNYGVWDNFEDIDFDSLPDKFVLKTTHDQGGVVICDDKKKFDYQNAKKKFKVHYKRKHFYLRREWPYKDVKPRIIAEEVLFDNDKEIPDDYKFYCFHGVPKVMLIATERFTGDTKFNYFDMQFNPIDMEQGGKQNEKHFEKPIGFETMIELSKKLSKGFPHVRVDFYNLDGKIYFGELTFYDSGGMATFSPQEYDYRWGEWVNLDQVEITK